MSPLKSCHQGQELSQGHQSLTEDGNSFCACLADNWYVPFIFLSMVPAANMNFPKRLPSCHKLAENGKIIFGIVWYWLFIQVARQTHSCHLWHGPCTQVSRWTFSCHLSYLPSTTTGSKHFILFHLISIPKLLVHLSHRFLTWPMVVLH